MKKLLLSFLSFFACCLALMAQTEITWSGQSDWTGIGTTDISYTSGNYTISASSKVTGCQTKPTVNAKANDFRCYANGITMVGNSTENIKKIVFHLSTQGIARWTDLTPSEGAVTNDTDNGLIVWEGDAQYVQFTVGAKAVYGPDVTQAGQFCFSSVTAYTAADLESGGGESGGGEGGEGEGGETPNPDEDITLYSETFGTNQGAFTIDDKELPEGTTYIWSFASGYGMKASAYVNKTNYASESWLVSPKFDCTNATALTLSFSEAANFFKSAENVSAYTSVKVKEVGTDTWTDLTLSARASGTAWTFTDGITADLSAYVGKKMQIAFVYTSSAELAGTWEVKNFELKGKGTVTAESEVVIPEYTTIAQLKNDAKATATAVKFTFTDLLVTGTAGTSTYVTDGTDGMLLFGTASPYKAGDKISGTISANLVSYSNLTELKDLDLTDVTVTSKGNVVTPVAATINELVANQKKYENVLVTLSEVTFVSDALASKNIDLTDGEEAITLRDNFGVLTDFIFDTKKQYNVTAIASIYKESIQLYALSADDIQMITNLVDPETAWAADTVAVMPGQEEYECALGTNYEGTITYSSSDETVATIDANGDITFVGYGHTVITAETPETSEYLASKASFDLFFIEGEGTLAKPYTPADVQYFCDKVEGKAWVKGEISGFFSNNKYFAGT
ncbi:MAG: choice-of-anchor J domain-containing protein [Bacteroidales bacterium]